ncbi:TetR/AcrR family transcriptional regulator [bacterium 210820-DFI.6.37]|nr:TetR/AcrR family transcriptional regulator [bacterium 210820-DFI.6.37]
MNTPESNTLERIHKAALEEFLAKGFQAASLRNIVKNAGVTTGAFYGYYKSKEALFDALAGGPADYFTAEFKKVQYAFKELSPKEQRDGVGEISGQWMLRITDYIYDHFDAFKLVIQCSKGTRFENFIHELVEVETEATHDFISVMEKAGKAIRSVDPWLEHILISGMFAAFFEMVIHDMPREQAKEYVKDLKDFQTAGWMKIMGL